MDEQHTAEYERCIELFDHFLMEEPEFLTGNAEIDQV